MKQVKSRDLNINKGRKVNYPSTPLSAVGNRTRLPPRLPPVVVLSAAAAARYLCTTWNIQVTQTTHASDGFQEVGLPRFKQGCQEGKRTKTLGPAVALPRWPRPSSGWVGGLQKFMVRAGWIQVQWWPAHLLCLCFDSTNAPFYYRVRKRRPYWALRPKSLNDSCIGPKFPEIHRLSLWYKEILRSTNI